MKLINQAKQAGSLVLAGDGRHDSMGHFGRQYLFEGMFHSVYHLKLFWPSKYCALFNDVLPSL